MGRNMGRKHREKKRKDVLNLEKKKEDDLQKKKEYEVFGIIAKEVFLKRLEEKSDIGRCRCVCKKWRRYLSTTEFGRMHLQYHHHQVTIDDYKLLLIDDECDPYSFPFSSLSLDETLPPFKPGNPMPRVSIFGSVDGLVCLGLNQDGIVGVVMLFMNPLSGACKRLARIPPEYDRILTSQDPIGFYFDSCDDDYKVLCLFSHGLDGAVVYSHRLDSWRQIDFSPLHLEELIYWAPPIFYGQSLYFDVTSSGSGCFRLVSRIIRFDVNTETFKEIALPSLAKATAATYYISAGLLVYKGCLRLYLAYNISDVMDGVDVWRIKDDDNLEKLHCFTREKQKRETLIMCAEAPGNWLAILDQHDNSFKKMTTDNFTSRYPCISTALKDYANNRRIYVETLVQP